MSHFAPWLPQVGFVPPATFPPLQVAVHVAELATQPVKSRTAARLSAGALQVFARIAVQVTWLMSHFAPWLPQVGFVPPATFPPLQVAVHVAELATQPVKSRTAARLS